MGFADGEDLLEVVLAVNELEFSPLVDVEGSKRHMARKFAFGPEEFFGFGAEQIEMIQMFGGGSDELLSGERMSRGTGRDHSRSFTSVREVAKTN